MYYTNGNYNAYMKPQKPKNTDGKSAYIVGAGLAGLAAAVFLIRDGQMEGKRITIFEELPQRKHTGNCLKFKWERKKEKLHNSSE